MILKERGITLIELLVVIVIVGVLAAVAIPGYTGYMQRARRAEAKTALEQLRAAQEMFRAERGRYANDASDVDALLLLQNTWGVQRNPVGDYNLVLNSTSATGFVGVAQAFTARQLTDGDLTIDQNGTKAPADKWAK